MAQIQLLKRRIKSVTNTRQITKAMELVAASKMRKAQEAMLRARPYASSAQEMLHQLYAVSHPEAHPLFQERPIKRELVIVVASDRGLAGAYNSNILRALNARIIENKQKRIATACIAIGQKVAQAVVSSSDIEILGVYTNWPTEPSSVAVWPISQTVIDQFSSAGVDSVQLIYTHFTSSLKQTVLCKQLLPIELPAETRDNKSISDITFEPSPEEVLNAIVPRLVEVQVFQATLEAVASEHSMRMMAMNNASDNAKSLVEELTQTYNTARQASITQELAEISSGVEAMQ